MVLKHALQHMPKDASDNSNASDADGSLEGLVGYFDVSVV